MSYSTQSTHRRGSFFGRAAENLATNLFIETKQRPRSESFFQRFVNKLKNQLHRIVRNDKSALKKVEEHGLCNVSLEGDFVQMKPKLSFPVKCDIGVWFQYLPPQKRLRQDLYANDVRSLRADRFRRDSDLDRYLGVHPGLPSLRKSSHLEPIQRKDIHGHQPLEPKYRGIGDQRPISLNKKQYTQDEFSMELDKLSWNESSGLKSFWGNSMADYSNIPIPPISPVLTPPPRRLSTPEREAKRRRLAAHRALEQHVSETCV